MPADPTSKVPSRGLRALLVARQRTWLLTVPIHVLAFAFLYFTTGRRRLGDRVHHAIGRVIRAVVVGDSAG